MSCTINTATIELLQARLQYRQGLARNTQFRVAVLDCVVTLLHPCSFGPCAVSVQVSVEGSDGSSQLDSWPFARFPLHRSVEAKLTELAPNFCAVARLRII